MFNKNVLLSLALSIIVISSQDLKSQLAQPPVDLENFDEQLKDVVTTTCNIQDIDILVNYGVTNFSINLTNVATYSKTSQNKNAYTTTKVTSGECTYTQTYTMSPSSYASHVTAKTGCIITGTITTDLFFKVIGHAHLQFRKDWYYDGGCDGYIRISVQNKTKNLSTEQFEETNQLKNLQQNLMEA